MGWAFLGRNGDCDARTPALDALGEKSAVFPNAVSSLSLPKPFRASLFTGQYAPSHGVVGEVSPEHTDRPFLRALTDAGYAVCLSETGDELETLARGGKPFALFVRLSLPGDPWGTDSETGIYGNKWFRRPPNYALGTQPHTDYTASRMTKREHEARNGRMRAWYHRLGLLDAAVGRLTAQVEELGLGRETLFAFTSDGGECFGAHGRRGGNIYYDEAVRVPLYFRQDYRLRPGERQSVIGTPDLMPTVLSLLDIPIPTDTEGRDRSGAVLRNEKSGGGALLTGMGKAYRWGDGLEWRGWRTERYTYALWRDGEEHLFDHAADPFECNDLGKDPDFQSLRDALREEMEAEMRRIGDGFLPMTAYKK